MGKKDSEWTLLDSISNHIDEEGTKEHALDINDPRDYILTGLLEETSDDDEYILLGRSYIDESNYRATEG